MEIIEVFGQTYQGKFVKAALAICACLSYSLEHLTTFAIYELVRWLQAGTTGLALDEHWLMM